MTLDPKTYDIDAFKRMCDVYLSESEAVEGIAKNQDIVKDCIMHVEDMIDEYDLGRGSVKGNFSKGKNK